MALVIRIDFDERLQGRDQSEVYIGVFRKTMFHTSGLGGIYHPAIYENRRSWEQIMHFNLGNIELGNDFLIRVRSDGYNRHEESYCMFNNSGLIDIHMRKTPDNYRFFRVGGEGSEGWQRMDHYSDSLITGSLEEDDYGCATQTGFLNLDDYTNNIVGFDPANFTHTQTNGAVSIGFRHYKSDRKPKVPCAVCGDMLDQPENFPEDYPKKFKLCCKCKSELNTIVRADALRHKFRRYIMKHKEECWAENES